MTIFLANTLLPAMRDWFYADTRWRSARRRRREGTRPTSHRSRVGSPRCALADGRTHLLGSELSAADFLATMVMRWSRNMPRPATTWKNLAPYIHRMRARPAFIEVNAREGLTDWSNPRDA